MTLLFLKKEIAADQHHELFGKNESWDPGWQATGQSHGQSRCQLENLINEWIKDTAKIGDLVVMARNIAIQDVSGPDADKKTKASVL